jgi:hypothetical protein
MRCVSVREALGKYRLFVQIVSGKRLEAFKEGNDLWLIGIIDQILLDKSGQCRSKAS